MSASLREAFLKTRAQTEAICTPLAIEDYVPQPVVFASPPKWHLAHSTWFFEEMILRRHYSQYEVFDIMYGFLFNSYYNHFGERSERGNRGANTRPTVAEVYAYREYVDRHMLELLQSDSLPADLVALITLGMNHEQQHQELLVTDLKYVLGHQPTLPKYDVNSNYESGANSEVGFVEMQEGIYEIGFEGEGFCFDNELNRHKVYLNRYAISKALVTNGEFIEFIAADGYKKFDMWLDEGWAWVKENGIQAPLYWHRVGTEWHQYTLAGLKKVDPNAILCHVSFYEAHAFATWKKMRLPTEAEWEVASPFFQWGTRWEWTNSAYLPYPGFAIAPGAVGEYNGKFMINQMVLRGASTATASGHSRPTYRNFFHPQHQWQFSGIRLAK